MPDKLDMIHTEVIETRKEVQEFRKDFNGRVRTTEKDLAGIKTRHDAEDAIRRPWYLAIVGAIVVAVAGLLGALVALATRR